ncbi:hypothetical protein BXZ70DRAFT_910810 [Cristinia sonorae]|uniref:Uncharacterized protein n=1 Tax=Cristinia sonorae TaxID=1940300 RepID=A0A8K0UH42_9AGAR|nr:hypothetical protein BXZ70DRAFT_910810 [Cristinia sonorae]
MIASMVASASMTAAITSSDTLAPPPTAPAPTSTTLPAYAVAVIIVTSFIFTITMIHVWTSGGRGVRRNVAMGLTPTLPRRPVGWFVAAPLERGRMVFRYADLFGPYATWQLPIAREPTREGAGHVGKFEYGVA